jgi:hypothetical protein
MKTSVKVALGMAMVWIIIDLVFFLAGFSLQFFSLGILINLFLLLVAISAGLFLTKKNTKFQESFFLDDFKTAAQSGIVYTLIVAGFTYMYHEYIDQGIQQTLRNDRMETFREMYPDKEAFAKLQEQDPQWQGKTFDSFIENQEDITAGMISSFSVFIFHLMGFFVFSLFFAFFGTLIMRKVILRI